MTGSPLLEMLIPSVDNMFKSLTNGSKKVSIPTAFMSLVRPTATNCAHCREERHTGCKLATKKKAGTNFVFLYSRTERIAYF